MCARRQRVGRLLCGLILGGLLSGCVNFAPLDEQRAAIKQNGFDHGEPLALESVPFFAQDQYQCGPAALASILSFEGESITPNDLVEEVYIPDRQGSLQPFMVAAVRKRGYLPYQRINEGISTLIKELDAGKPVLVLQNLGISQLPVWHYAVVVGWLPETQTFVVHTGDQAAKKLSLKFFEYTWRASQYWSLTLYQSDQTPIDPSENQWLTAAAGLEQIGQWQAAYNTYQKIEEYFPQQFLATMGRGNSAYRLGNYPVAERAFRHALNLTDKPHAPAHNLAWALIKQGKYEEARPFAERAKEEGGDAFGSAWAALATH